MTGKRILHAFTMTFIMVGMLYFYMVSDFDVKLWASNQFYFAFAKAVDVLLISCIIFPLREVWREWLCIGVFFAAREAWESFAIRDYASANRPSIIFSLFLVDTLCLLNIIIIKILRRRK